ncbi:hypothetical protein TI39_contig352g00067 [Zymoseptoria brevis]|uniref:Uncharacterized protein n=1 Tax=Zymoseptoria brevis TaxID=1047168 RepID=A0A0F4GQK9_9PEZI|nr:hypothetical protein TI39_contig352g00067 [Zymoseptoria brevis]
MGNPINATCDHDCIDKIFCEHECCKSAAEMPAPSQQSTPTDPATPKGAQDTLDALNSQIALGAKVERGEMSPQPLTPSVSSLTASQREVKWQCLGLNENTALDTEQYGDYPVDQGSEQHEHEQPPEALQMAYPKTRRDMRQRSEPTRPTSSRAAFIMCGKSFNDYDPTPKAHIISFAAVLLHQSSRLQ